MRVSAFIRIAFGSLAFTSVLALALPTSDPYSNSTLALPNPKLRALATIENTDTDKETVSTTLEKKAAWEPKYICHVTLYDGKDWSGKWTYFQFQFEGPDNDCRHLGDTWNDRTSSIHIEGSRECECVLHQDTCGAKRDREIKRIWRPGIKDFSPHWFDNRATALSCHVPRTA